MTTTRKRVPESGCKIGLRVAMTGRLQENSSVSPIESPYISGQA